jgi:hypothetical protein
VRYKLLPATRWFLARLIFDPEDGGDAFLRNVGSHTDYRRYIPENGDIKLHIVYSHISTGRKGSAHSSK